MANSKRKVASHGSIIPSSKRRRHHHQYDGRHQRRQRLGWSNIPYDILEYILKFLLCADKLQCRAVCRAWRLITRSHFSHSLKSLKQPLFLWDKNYEYLYSFLDVTRAGKKLYHLNLRSKQLLRRYVDDCVGYSQGWFLFLDRETQRRLCLFHPLLFSGTAIWFPPIVTPKGTNCRQGIAQAVLWADPISSRGSYGLVIIHESYSRHLLFAKCGSTRFSPLSNPKDFGDDPTTIWRDIICFQSCVFGITQADNGDHFMFAWDFTGEEPRMVLDCQPKFSDAVNSPFTRKCRLYLVESEGELLLVSIEKPDSKHLRLMQENERIGTLEMYVRARCTNMCQVYKMDFKEKKWVRMYSLGDRFLYITEFQAISLSTREFPKYEKNSVYFDHFINAFGCDLVVAVFNLDGGSMKEIYIE